MLLQCSAVVYCIYLSFKIGETLILASRDSIYPDSAILSCLAISSLLFAYGCILYLITTYHSYKFKDIIDRLKKMEGTKR